MIIAGGSTIGGYAYSSEIEPYQIDITHRTFPLQRLPSAFNGFTITQISDLHFGDWMTFEHMLSVVEKVNQLESDIIVITGDFVSAIYSTTADNITNSLRQLQAEHGVYAVLGNHDHWTNAQTVSNAIRASGTQLLVNEHTTFERNGEQLYLAGVDDIWEDMQDLEGALDGIPDDSCIVLLAHEPDYADTVAQDGRVSLQLSGHSHGGQVRLPFIGALILPNYGRNYDMGDYTIDDLTLYVNRGVGMIQPSVRFNCPPEITHITLETISN